MTPEGQVQSEILEYLRARGIFHWRSNNGAIRAHGRMIQFGKIGASDILGIMPDGRLLAIEVKAAGKYPTTAQAIFINDIKARGGVAFVAWSVQDVINGLSRRDE